MKNENKMKYFVYMRKSTEAEDRQILSIQSQKDEMMKIIKDDKISIVDFIDESYSAKKPGRAKFNEMIRRIENGEANAILSWNPNRLSRNSVDTGIIIYLLDQKKLIEVKTPTQIFKDTPNDKFLLNLFCSQAKLENDNKSVDVIRGMNKKAKNGWFPGQARPGYYNDKYGEKGEKEILPDQIRFPLIKKVFKTILSRTHSPAQVLEMLNNDWGYTSGKRKRLGRKPMRKSQFYKMLSDPFYYGYFKFGGEIYKGKHEAMISKEEYENIQSLLGRNQSSPNGASYNDVFYRTFTCGECGGQICPDVKIQTICSHCKTKFASRNRDVCPNCKTKIFDMVNPKQLRYVYYTCKGNKNPNCSQKRGVNEESVLSQLKEELKKIRISEKMTKWFVAQLSKINNKEVKDLVNIGEALREKLNDTKKTKQNLIKLKIAPNNINGEIMSDDEFVEQKNIVDKEITDLMTKIHGAEEKSKLWTELAIDTFNFACYASYHFDTGDYETKKNILTGFGSNIEILDGKVNVILPKHLEIIKRVNNLIITKKEIIEPKEFVLHKRKTGSLEPVSPTWHGRQESNPR